MLSLSPATGQHASQSDGQRAYLRQLYDASKLYYVMQTAADGQRTLDMAVSAGTLVAVIKERDPMGDWQRWFVDDGGNCYTFPASESYRHFGRGWLTCMVCFPITSDFCSICLIIYCSLYLS